MSTKRHFVTFTMSAMLLALGAGSAQASHFRGATLYWERVSGNTVTFTSVQEWKSDDVDTQPINPGDGDPALIGPVTILFTGTDTAGESYRIVTYSVTHTYASAGPFTAFVGSLSGSLNCCRLNSPVNGGGDDYRIEALVDLRDALNMGSPATSVPPVAVSPMIVQMPAGTANASVDLFPGISDPDGDTFTCALATPGSGAGQSGMGANPIAGGNPLTITAGCELQWDTTFATAPQKYTVQVEILESRGSGFNNRVATDFILEIVPATCGDDAKNQLSEDCDGADDSACPGFCLSNCKCPVCGDNSINQPSEECDGTAGGVLGPCPGNCRPGPGPGACQCRECGDNILDMGEECDGTDDAACDGACTADCTCGFCGDNDVNAPGETCDGIDDSACPGHCRPDGTTGECTCAICGDGIRDTGGGEQCDGADATLCPGQCTGACTCPTCGDNVKQGLEQCDGSDSASCPGTCGAPAGPNPCQCPTCGDNDVNAPGETCDGTDAAACPGLCRPPLDPNQCECPVCGDGDVNQLSEQCDGGDDATCPGNCLVNCTCATCGNNVAQAPAEDCDGTDDAACDGLCRPPGDANECQCPTCGDNDVNAAGEVCDGTDDAACDGLCRPPGDANECKCPICGDNDVNAVGEICDGTDDAACPGGCLNDCTCPVCGDNAAEGSEQCDGTDDAACDGLCRPPGDANECQCPICGDDDVNQLGEQCDGTDDGLCPGDCTFTCVCAICGNNLTEAPAETCDGTDDAACDGLCRPPGDVNECHCPVCGDGDVNQVSEQCDDGPGNSDTQPDACRTDCQLPTCGDGVTDTGEDCDSAPISEQCNNRTDDDGDNAIDCADADCDTTCVTSGGMTFDPPSVPKCTKHAECRAVDPDAHCVGVPSCDATCGFVLACEPAGPDPSVIRFNDDGPDQFSMHVLFAPQSEAFPAIEGLSLLITNTNGVVYQATLFQDDLVARDAGGKRFSFRDPNARSGNGTRDGLAKVAIRFKVLGGIPVITFKIQAFGDLSAATLAHMTTQISIGNDGTFVDGEWQPSATGWRLTPANLRQR